MSTPAISRLDSEFQDSHYIDVYSQTDTEETSPEKKKSDSSAYKIKEVLTLSLLTYAATSGVFYLIGNEAPLANALVPTTGYFISTLEKEKVVNLAQRAKNTIQSCFSLFTRKKDER